ncbi:MAG: tRNA dihydrouridine synthase DusB [Clostridiales bacterium]|nr:tRNA dihydrouridine synthase DusB [Clostridiales bacterium]
MRIGTVEIGDGALLAPMAGITEMPFRALCRRMGAALVYTEMVSVNSLLYRSAEAETLLDTSPEERPVAVQLFGDDPALMADMAARWGERYDLIDLNMGCPAPKIVKAGRGCALMRNPALAAQIAQRVCAAAGKPVTAKIRAGWDEESRNAVEFARRLEDAGIAAVCVHGRTRSQQYSGAADLRVIARVKEALSIPVIGNGDVDSGPSAARMLRETGCDAVMVGRAARGNPWVFEQIAHYLRTGETLPGPSCAERLGVAIEHGRMLAAQQGETLAALKMRKHMAWYLHGARGAAACRRHLMAARSLSEMEEMLAQCLTAGES